MAATTPPDALECGPTPLHSEPCSDQPLLPVAGQLSRSSVHERGRLVIDPNDSCLLNVWDIFVAVLLVATAVLAPFETAFLEPKVDSLLVFDCAVDGVFVVDLLLQFFIAYPDTVHPERLVKDPQRVVRNYLATWFVVDLVSALPVDAYQVLAREGYWSFACIPGLRDLKFIRLVRLLRLTRFARLFRRWHTSFGFSYANISLAKFLVVVLLCCHWMACLWGAMAVKDPRQTSWLSALREAKGGPPELYEGSFQVYTMSLYWAIITITSIGYGDITPQNTTEYWAATLCTSIMASIWAYVIGAVCGIVSTMNPHEVAFKRTLDDLNWLMGDRKMPYEMCKTLRRYFHETRDINRQRTEQELIAQMSPKLQGEYAHFMHKRWIAKVWYLRSMNYEIIVWAARHLTMAVYAPHEEVLSERTLFIVQRGLCALKGKVLVSGDIWGEDMLLSNEFLRDREKARSLGYLSVLMLHVLDLVDVVANFPEARARLRWAQVQIALIRGVRRISEAMRELQVRHGLRSEDLNDEQRMELFADILQGKFAHRQIPQDYFCMDIASKTGARAKAAKRLCSRLSSASFSSSANASNPEARLEDLSHAVSEISRNLQELGQKVDHLCMGQSNRANVYCRSRSSVADFGPMVRPASSSYSSLGSSGSHQKAVHRLGLQGDTSPDLSPSYARCMRPGPFAQRPPRGRVLPTLLP